MRPNPYIVQGFKYATLTLAGMVVLVALAAAFKYVNTASLTGRLVPEQDHGIIPTVHFSPDDAMNGFSVPTDTHAIFEIPAGVRIPRITFFGGPDTDLARYWGYCFSGNEAKNKADGKMGKAMYDGRFFYSLGERKAQAARPQPADSNLLGIYEGTRQRAKEELASVAEIFNGGDVCYVMTTTILPASIDTDGDDLNNKRETLVGTDPNNKDTDGDGIWDGNEVFVTKTNPRDPDTDHDGLSDLCEDKNQSGQVDTGETSPLVADTDRDELCDGNGWGNGCPEKKKQVCNVNPDPAGDLVCQWVMSSPVYGEDMNQNCKVDKDETDPTKPETFGIPDWDYKWDKFQAQTGYRVGKDAPEFPIPSLPVYAPAP
jgi:hypothetical protein